MCVEEVVGSCYRVHGAQLGAVMTWRAGVGLGGEKLGPESRMHGRMEEP